ncbi:methionyl-tRNA formyltransferase [Helicobacter suis]|uniref:methionyl-tRNA formyltransferase n=1 Tax=Helicobacter suis TaxID=104628 RepID=UPI002490EC72|nr:methionyl-tRNA formyltransferase [Helicobacter suis]
MKILFMGTPLFAQVVLAHLLEEGFEVVGLITQPSKPFGRQQQMKDSATKVFIQEKQLPIPVFEPLKIDDLTLQTIQNLKSDVVVVVAYGKILPQSLLNLVPCINLHGSLLPQFRGASPIQEMILHDLSEFGVSVIKMSAQMDAGDILGMDSFIKDRDYNAEELGTRLACMGARLVARVLNQLEQITPIPQDHTKATYCKKISKENGLVAFDSAKTVYLKSLAYTPWPGVFLKSGLKLFGIELINTQDCHQEGEILALEGESVLVGCLRGVLKIATLQAPGKQKIAAKSYLSGKRLKVGEILN